MMRLPFTVPLILLAFSSVADGQTLRISERLEDLEARARQDSLDPAAHYNLALGYISRNRPDQADTALLRSLAIDPQFAPAWLARSIVKDRDERYWRNLRRSGGDSAVRREADLREGFSRRAFLIDPFVDLRIMGSVSRHSGYGAISAGMRGLVEGNYETAFDGFSEAQLAWRRLFPRDSVPNLILFFHGLSAAHSNRVPEAIEIFRRLLRRSSVEEAADTTRQIPLQTNEFRYMLAYLLQRSNERAEAEALYRQVLENDVGNYMAQVQLARMAEAANDWSAAVTHRRAAAQTNPEDHTMHIDLGVTLARVGQWAEAEEALLEARRLNGRDPRVDYRLGIVQQQLGKTAEARGTLTRFVEVAPSRYGAAVRDARARLAQLPQD